MKVTEAMLLTQRKALGAFYTPKDAAHYMASWAMRTGQDVILEPSIGDGQFLAAANEVAEAKGWGRPRFVAAEINPQAANGVVSRGLVEPDELLIGDFLSSAVRPVDAAIGNPPYVRLRALSGTQSETAQRAALTDIGERMQTSGSVWMPFVARAARFLKPNGRLALVLPWDFTYVKYARPLWRHLSETFGSLRVVRVRERLFPDISQDVLLLFAEGKGRRTSDITFEAHRTVEDLYAGTPEARATVSVDRVLSGERAFQEALLPPGLTDLLTASQSFTVPARELMTFNIGYVSGDKDYFHPGPEHGLPDSSLYPALTNARRLRGGGLYTSELPPSAQSMLWLPDDELDDSEVRYERLGRRDEVHLRYKCQVRDPWYRVPGVWVPDVVLSVFAQRPILMINDGEHVATNSLLCGYLQQGDAASFVAGWYNSLTLLNAELEVHSLGGGVLVLVPNEAGNVRMAKPRVVGRSVLPLVNAALRAGDLDEAYRAGDAALGKRMGGDAVELVREGIRSLEAWRVARPATT